MQKQKIDKFQFCHSNFAEHFEAQPPCSAYSVLTDAGVLQDPYFGEREEEARVLSDGDCWFTADFTPEASFMNCEHLLLCLNGIDTVSEIYLNGVFLGKTDNMHRRWEFDVRALLRPGENQLGIHIFSPTEYIRRRQEQHPLWSGKGLPVGMGHIRKSYCSFGWDWAPSLPDMGILGDVALEGFTGGRIENLTLTQRHTDEAAELVCAMVTSAPCSGVITVYDPDGLLIDSQPVVNGRAVLRITRPALWWPNGYGAQPLYRLSAVVRKDGVECDRCERLIGLRSLTVSRAADTWGKEFCFVVNGVKIFARGADYIPMDSIVPRVNRCRMERLLRDAAEANYNCLRVWGGGYYPEDDFYELCDRLGLIVWQDFMFSLSYLHMLDDFVENIRMEAQYQVARIGWHACVGLFCGNNEIEESIACWKVPKGDLIRKDYLELYERILPSICRQYAPDTFYWPSSPSSGGGFENPEDVNNGDRHFLNTWFQEIPPEEFPKYCFRFVSEFCMQGYPGVKTIRAFAGEDDMNPFSPVMMAHQKAAQGNLKLLSVLSDRYRLPASFGALVYLSQLHQADVIRIGTEHFRVNRGQCMGVLYWQLNDCWPVISWSSIDYFGRWKALHYAAKHFYAPRMICFDDRRLCVCNETREHFQGTVKWRVCENDGSTVASGREAFAMHPLSVRTWDAEEMLAAIEEMPTRRYLYFQLLDDAGRQLQSGTQIFVLPKNFSFLPSAPACEVRMLEDAFEVTITASVYTKAVYLETEQMESRWSDNFFDLSGGETVCVRAECPEAADAAAFKRDLRLQCLNQLNYMTL